MEQQKPKDEGKKKPYSPPVLLEYGNIAKLTQTGGSPGADGATRAPRPCL